MIFKNYFCSDISPVYLFTQPTNNITYLNMTIDFKELSESMKLFIPLFAHIISRMGADGLSSDKLTLQCNAKSSGFNIVPLIQSHYDSCDDCHFYLHCCTHFLDSNFSSVLSLWEKIFNKLITLFNL